MYVAKACAMAVSCSAGMHSANMQNAAGMDSYTQGYLSFEQPGCLLVAAMSDTTYCVECIQSSRCLITVAIMKCNT